MKAYRYPAFTIGLMALVGSCSAQGATGNEPTTQVVELTPYFITGKRDLPPPEKWQYAKVGDFEVLSNASDRSTRQLLRDFQTFCEAVQVIRPVPAKPLVSASLILCGSKGKFTDFTPDGQRDYTGVVSFTLGDREHAAIVIDLETRTINSADFISQASGADASGNVEMEVDHYRQLYRAYARFLLGQTDYPPPPWFIEGVTQMIMDIEFSERVINYGKLDYAKGAPTVVGGDYSGDGLTPPGDMLSALNRSFVGAGREAQRDEETIESISPDVVVGDRQFNVALTRSALMPLDRFFAVTAESSVARNPLGHSLWAKQAYAFVHMCTFRADAKFREPLTKFVQRSANEPVSEQLFEECFKLSYKEMIEELRRYIRNPQHKFRHIELAKESLLTATDVVFREATQGEIGRIKGDAQRLGHRQADALFSYQVAYARGERNPRLLASLGIEEQKAGHPERARKLLEAAVSLGTDLPSAYVALARARLDEAKAAPAVGDRLSAAQLVPVLDPLFKARARKPALPETYEVMAEAWTLSAVPPKVANVQVLGEGVMLFPFNSNLAYEAARLHAQAGDSENAIAIARMGIRFTADESVRSRFEKLLLSLSAPKSPTQP